MPLRIATWNVNSLRQRLDHLARFAAEHQPDVICLQEIKLPTEIFPADALTEMGYPHHLVHGQKGYNGVAIVSRRRFTKPRKTVWCKRDDCRHVAVDVGGLELHNFYVPAGGDVPDPQQNDKFAHKLGFLDEMAGWFADRRAARDGAMVLVGDLNIAPLESDVWSHKQLLKVVSHTPVEVDALDRVAQSCDWVDAVRHFVPADQKLYTWWSYRARDWEASDRGRRLDHIWVTQPLAPTLQGYRILKEARGWPPKPSDHVPVLARFTLG